MHAVRSKLIAIDVNELYKREIREEIVGLTNYSRDIKSLMQDSKLLCEMQEIDLDNSNYNTANAATLSQQTVAQLTLVKDTVSSIHISIALSIVGICVFGPLGGAIAGILGTISGIGSGISIGAVHYSVNN
jgi:hypothetical protein|tara:strand:+ start:716 stop:1108 length:393 start_codon:yes stop_codon:yes gene_type:complete